MSNEQIQNHYDAAEDAVESEVRRRIENNTTKTTTQRCEKPMSEKTEKQSAVCPECGKNKRMKTYTNSGVTLIAPEPDEIPELIVHTYPKSQIASTTIDAHGNMKTTLPKEKAHIGEMEKAS